MRVFILQEIIPNYRVPVFRRLAQLAGMELTVFYSEPSRAMRSENLKNVEVVEGFRHIKLGLWEFGSHVYQFGILWRVIVSHPHVVITGQSERLDSLVLMLLCKLLRIRFLWFQGGVPYIDKTKIQEYADRGRLNRWLGRYNPKRWLAHMADGLIVYSEHAASYYKKMGFNAKKVWVAPNSPDTDALQEYREMWQKHPGELENMKRRFAPSGQKILFLLGRLNRERKVDVLLRALRQLLDRGIEVSLVIVGDGDERQYLAEMVSGLGLTNVYFEGAIYDEQNLARYFLISDIFVTPGIASMAIKMAMSFGTPVITVDYGLEVHAVEEGANGLIFPMDNADVLAEKIQMLLGSEELMSRLSKGGVDTIKNSININRMVEGFRQAIFSE